MQRAIPTNAATSGGTPVFDIHDIPPSTAGAPFDTPQIKAAITAFRGAHPDCEIVLLSTCNRVELYTTRPAHSNGTISMVPEFVTLL